MAEVPKLLGGRYEVGELLGRGGMAEVHRGYDSRLGRQVAIKMLRSELARDQTFLSPVPPRGAVRRRAQPRLDRRGLRPRRGRRSSRPAAPRSRCPTSSWSSSTARPCARSSPSAARSPPTEALRITEGVLDALGYSHRNGIVHRDIKPANVMIAADGSIKVMDFGIARAMADANATMTQTQAVIGTAQYLSPEQAQGQSVDERSDLYSTGCMLFELLTGRPPFLGESPVSIAYQHVGEQPLPPSRFVEGISEDLDAVVLHSLAKPRDARYQSAGRVPHRPAGRAPRPPDQRRGPRVGRRPRRRRGGAAPSRRGRPPRPSRPSVPTQTQAYAGAGSARRAVPPGPGTETFPGPARRSREEAQPGGWIVARRSSPLAALAALGYGLVHVLRRRGDAPGRRAAGRRPDPNRRPWPSSRRPSWWPRRAPAQRHRARGRRSSARTPTAGTEVRRGQHRAHHRVVRARPRSPCPTSRA